MKRIEPIFLFFSVYSTTHMKRRASEAIKARRREHDVPVVLIQHPQPCEWSARRLNNDTLIQPLVQREGEVSAKDPMKRHLDISIKNCLVVPSKFTLRNITVVGAPVLDFLSLDIDRGDTLAYPTSKDIQMFQQNRGIDWNSDPTFKIEEIIVGKTSGTEILRISEDFDHFFRKNQESFPSNCVSISMNSISVHPRDFFDIFSNVAPYEDAKSNPVKFSTKTTGVKTHDIPSHILVGDGLTYAVLIRWPISLSDDILEIIPTKPQYELMKFLADLPIAVGVDIKNTIHVIDTFFSQMSDPDALKMRGWLDLSTLAVFAGYAPTNYTKTALNGIVLGGIFAEFQFSDNELCLSWTKLPTELRVHFIKDVQSGHMLLNVLGSVAIRSIFPDMDSAGYILDTNKQIDIARKCFSWIVETLCSKEINKSPNWCRSRLELLELIQIKHLGKFSGPLAEVTVWDKIFGDWSPITNGGPKYLHQVRFQMLALLKLANSDEGKLSPFLKKDLIAFSTLAGSYLTYCQPPIDKAHFKAPLPHTGTDLYYSENLPHKQLSILPEDMIVSRLSAEGKSDNRPYRYMLYEKLRLNPREIPEVIKRMDSSSQCGGITKALWVQYYAMYEDICLMEERIFDRSADRIAWLEKAINDRLQNALQHERQETDKARRTLEIRENRLKYITDVVNRGPNVLRSGVGARLEAVKANLPNQSPITRKRTTNVPFPEFIQQEKKRKLNLTSHKPLPKIPTDSVQKCITQPKPGSSNVPTPVPNPSMSSTPDSDRMEEDEEHETVVLSVQPEDMFEEDEEIEVINPSEPVEPEENQWMVKPSGMKIHIPDKRTKFLLRKKLLEESNKEKKKKK